ncbi:phosphatase PAP2 family protein [Dongshaea marina]|uniref:phosphatase PAP2 family protein n=1 Tax=Dongshaea marina TaxID=2047966 RepID=UPI000D3E870C|nr:phosphatase PAP2 family protein [Dongshaea marina]
MFYIKKQLITLVILLIVISISFISEHLGVRWYPMLDLHSSFASILYGLTLSVSSKGLIVTLIVLLLISAGSRPFCLNRLVILVGCLLVALAVAWGTKTVVKHVTQESRPYLEQLAAEGKIPSTDSFYQLKEADRGQLIKSLKLPDTPAWLQQHLTKEVNYSFPSGHSIAAITLVMFFMPIWFSMRRPGWLVGLLVLWGVGVCYSRLLLGLHWPGDVLASSIFGSVFGLAMANIFLLYQRSRSSNRPGRRIFSSRKGLFD